MDKAHGIGLSGATGNATDNKTYPGRASVISGKGSVSPRLLSKILYLIQRHKATSP
jgi:hypothetical protein|uniref:hypothetical protein n=1 Tax=Halomonas bluephagenesis TaxID=2778948 RepID=UPI002E26C103|tara:strand:+ start:1243 stop:1410 length:168 start_codon:yes stop_codon:yes gene_type:complete